MRPGSFVIYYAEIKRELITFVPSIPCSPVLEWEKLCPPLSVSSSTNAACSLSLSPRRKDGRKSIFLEFLSGPQIRKFPHFSSHVVFHPQSTVVCATSVKCAQTALCSFPCINHANFFWDSADNFTGRKIQQWPLH